MTALVMLFAPVALFLAGGVFLMQATGRARFRRRRSEPASEPLNFRFRGYSPAAAAEYWRWLGPDGLAAERRFLKADMVFPLWYGAALFASLYAGWAVLGRPFQLAWLALPVAITLVADWIENVVHLRQIARFDASLPLQDGQIRLASVATSTKLLFFWLSTLLVVILSGWVLIAGAARADG